MQQATTLDRSRDAELHRLLAVDVDSDRGESPFGWTDLPAPATETGGPDA